VDRLRQALVVPLLFAPAFLATGWWSILPADPPKLATVPALAVSIVDGREVGNVHYIAVQLDRDPQGRGPTVQFNEASVGTAVDQVWKEGAQTALRAAARLAPEDERYWTVTIKNRSYYSISSGSSASSAIAVAILAAWRGHTIRSDVVVTGVITADGRIEAVGDLPTKLQGAVKANMRAMLVPKGEGRTNEWNLFELGQQQHINVVEVGTLQEAYEMMTGISP
jgi:uncharacterized protein